MRHSAAVQKAQQVVRRQLLHGGWLAMAQGGDVVGDARQRLEVVDALLAAGPAHGVNAIGFNEQAIIRRLRRHGGHGRVQARKRADAHVAAQGQVVVEMVAAGIPVHVVGVGVVTNHRQHLSLLAFGMEHHRTLPLAGKGKLTLLRHCAVFYSAIVAEQAPASLNFDTIREMDPHRIRTDLIPVLRLTERFNLQTAPENTIDFLSGFMIPTTAEIAFWRAFNNKEYHPDFIFSDPTHLDRITQHPMAR